MKTAKKKYETCLRIMEDALKRLSIKKNGEVSDAYLNFINDYVNDARHFAKSGDFATALEAVAYAHGFIDAGVLGGFFEIGGEYHLEEAKKGES